MRIGILSCEHIHALSYVSALKHIDGVEIVGIAESNELMGKNFAQNSQIRYYKDYQDLLKEDIDAVIICSANVKHKDMAVDAANAKKHVIVEKPIATTIEDAEKMIEECNKNGVKLMVSFPVRYEPSVKRTKEIIDSGKIGDIIAINGTNRGKMPGSWFIDKSLSGGGCVIDHTVHVVDLMHWILHSDIKEVYAKMGTMFNDIPVEDGGLLSMEFENGTYATLDTSWSRPVSFPTWGDVTMEIIGTKGTIRLDAFAQHG
ncbi:MAG: Gfo/Idh/MocA family oxidoreductase, partial [Thermoanaerobacterium sp.]|nr:Gfo/Idh/MocA family oxidoreductase [Thermoanaerobacterium sp.]